METRHPPQPPESPVAAAAFILVASALIAGTTLLAKLVGQDHLGAPLHPLQISHGRFLFAFLAISGAVLALRPGFHQVHWQLHVARSAAGWLGISLMFAGLYDFIGFSVIPAATSLLGAGIIIAGGVILAGREARAPRRRN